MCGWSLTLALSLALWQLWQLWQWALSPWLFSLGMRMDIRQIQVIIQQGLKCWHFIVSTLIHARTHTFKQEGGNTRNSLNRSALPLIKRQIQLGEKASIAVTGLADGLPDLATASASLLKTLLDILMQTRLLEKSRTLEKNLAKVLGRGGP